MQMNKLCGVGLALFAALGSASFIHAALVRPFSIRFSATTRGNIVIIGNTLTTCADSVTNCAAIQSAFPSTDTNNTNATAFVDIDSTPSTLNSSQNRLALPPNAQVLWAGLYWGASLNGAPQPRIVQSDTVRLITPNQNNLIVKAVQLDINGTEYQGFADVTTHLQLAGSGNYTVTDVQGMDVAPNRYAGWALAVVYAAPDELVRNITIYDGYGTISSSSTPTATLAIQGLTVPASGPVRTDIGVVAYEGDRGIVGDSVLLNGVPLSNSLNPGNDFFNSTLSQNAGMLLAGKPAYSNTLGFDIDMVNADGILANGATTATVTLVTAGDIYHAGAVAFATEVFAPALSVTKRVTPSNPTPTSTVHAGDVLTYEIALSNVGADAASNVVVTDAIPSGTNYVTGSAHIAFGANAGGYSDSVGDDAIDFTGSSLVFRVGAGASALSGGTLLLSNTNPISHSAVLRFAVQVHSTITHAITITNQALVSFAGATLSDTQFSASSNFAVVTGTATVSTTPPITPSVVEPVGLGISKVVSPDRIFNGDIVTYTITISNPSNANFPRSSAFKIPSDTVATFGPAALYPASIQVDGLDAVQSISVTLNGLNHEYAPDLDVVLAGPQGQRVMLMSDVGGNFALNNVSLNFADGAPALPEFTQISSGTYAPTNEVGNDVQDVLPSPAPPLPYGGTLAAFKGTNPNGPWRLFVFDDQARDIGGLSGGWQLHITTQGQTVTFNSAKPLHVEDVLPVGLKLLSSTPGYDTIEPHAWVLDSLAASTARVFTFTAQVQNPGAGVVTNTATIASLVAAELVTPALSTAVLQVDFVSLSANITPIAIITPGGELPASIQFCNTGNITATGVTISITVPPVFSSITLPPYAVFDPVSGVYQVPIGNVAQGSCALIDMQLSVPSTWPPDQKDLGIGVLIGDDGAHGVDPQAFAQPAKRLTYLPIILK